MNPPPVEQLYLHGLLTCPQVALGRGSSEERIPYQDGEPAEVPVCRQQLINAVMNAQRSDPSVVNPGATDLALVQHVV